MENHEALKAKLKTLKNSLKFEKDKLDEIDEYKSVQDLKKQINETKAKLIGDEPKKPKEKKTKK